MKANNLEKVNSAAIAIILLGCIGIFSVIAFDKLYLGTDLLAEGWPVFSLGYIIRSIIIFISIIAIFWSLPGNSKPRLILDKGKGLPLERLSILGVLSASVTFLFLFILKPSIFSRLSLEDGPVEWGSAILLFVSWIIFAIYFLKSRNVLNIPKCTQITLALLSLVYFVMAMEEVSWFQRALEIETPNVFGVNLKHQWSIHNISTNLFENIYYFGAFLFLVVLPLVRLLFPFVSNNYYLSIFVARPFIGIIGSAACAYNFDMWNIVFTQLAFFGSIVILFLFAKFSSSRNDRYIILLAIIIVVATQVLFLIYGENFARSWEVTEYKELLIPLALFIYSLDVSTCINRVYLSEKNQ